jgi:hypothetical protein
MAVTVWSMDIAVIWDVARVVRYIMTALLENVPTSITAVLIHL